MINSSVPTKTSGDNLRDLVGTERVPFDCCPLSLPEFTPLADGVNTHVAPARLFGRFRQVLKSAEWTAQTMSNDSVWIGFLPGLTDSLQPRGAAASIRGG
jgi:hypothetical protein